jgi:hypothetical protein
MLHILENNFANAPVHVSCASTWVYKKLLYIDDAYQQSWIRNRLKRELLLRLESKSILDFYLTYKRFYKVTFAELVLGIDIVLEYLSHHFIPKPIHINYPEL